MHWHAAAHRRMGGVGCGEVSVVVVGFLFGTVWRHRIPRGESIFSYCFPPRMFPRGVSGLCLEPKIQGAWRAAACCRVADLVGEPLSRHRAIGSGEPRSCRGWAKLQRWLSYVCVACRIVAIAPPWPRRLRGLSRHRAIGPWTNAGSCRGWAKQPSPEQQPQQKRRPQQQRAQLRRSYPDVRVACQVVDFALP